jgi:hypothetical protein
MKLFRRLLDTFLSTPFTWVFYCFFQPMHFKQSIEVPGKKDRFLRMLQLAYPLFLCAYPLGVLTSIIFHLNQHSLSSWWISATIAALLALSASIIIGGLLGLVYGILGGIAGTFGAAVIVVSSSGVLHNASAIPAAVGLAAGVAGMTGGIVIGSARDITRSSKVEANIGSALGLLLGIPPGLLLGIVAGIIEGPLSSLWKSLSPYRSVASTLSGAMLGLSLSVLIIITLHSTWRRGISQQLLSIRIERSLSAIYVACIASSAVVGGILGASGSDVGNTLPGILAADIAQSILIVPFMLVSYLLGYYRLPLYPVSGFSSLKAYLLSRHNPTQVFARLHRSALYWDECVFLPLPYLTRTLYLASEQDTQQTLNEIAFIVAKRPTQYTEARAAAMEIALRDLEERETLRHFAQATDRLAEIFPKDAMLIAPRWEASFSRLNDASREAARYQTLMSRQARRNALDEMILNLKRVTSRVYDEHALNRRLQLIVKRWLAVVQQELETLARLPEESGYIDNPYISGSALKPQSQQFVGRHDLVRQLEHSLRKGENRPCFFLTGERRMGKTSTLNQLPVLLGAHYIPLIFDLQARGFSANVAAFLFEIAQSTSKALDARGVRVPPLEYESLNSARRENEAMAYRLFDRWLVGLETALEQRDRVLLIAFDEFEKLEEASQAQYLDMQLLLDWFRSIIQHHPSLALLFSGVKTPGEMASRWAGHFVNVKTLRVSFLHPTDAYQLITRPIEHYPSDQIFGEGVVDEIMRVTGCHPFLIQAICSELIDILNADLHDRAGLTDVERAMNSVLESWGDTYFRDLWERTDLEQRICLRSLGELGHATISQIREQSNLSEQQTHLALQTLCKRDLARTDQEIYCITVPIFHAWLERNSYTI